MVENEAKVVLPATVVASFSGLAQAFMGTQQGLTPQLALTVIVNYIILGVLYESYVHPITILSGLPFRVRRDRVGRRSVDGPPLGWAVWRSRSS